MIGDNALDVLVVWLLAASLTVSLWGLAVGASAIRRWRREQREREAGDE